MIFINKLFLEEEMVAKSISKAKQWQEAQHSLPRQASSPLDEPHIQEFVSGFVCYMDAA